MKDDEAVIQVLSDRYAKAMAENKRLHEAVRFALDFGHLPTQVRTRLEDALSAGEVKPTQEEPKDA